MPSDTLSHEVTVTGGHVPANMKVVALVANVAMVGQLKLRARNHTSAPCMRRHQSCALTNCSCVACFLQLFRGTVWLSALGFTPAGVQSLLLLVHR